MEVLGGLGGLLEGFENDLGPSWNRFGLPLGPSWAALGSPWAILGPSWGLLGLVWGELQATLGVLRRKSRKGLKMHPLPREMLIFGVKMEPSWAQVGPS